MSSPREVCDQLLGIPGGFEIAAPVRISQQRAGVGQINPLWIRPGRIEINAEYTLEIHIHGRFPRLALRRKATKDSNRSSACIRDEHIPVRSPTDLPWVS